MTKTTYNIVRARKQNETEYMIFYESDYWNLPKNYIDTLIESYLFKDFDPETGTGLNYEGQRIQVI